MAEHIHIKLRSYVQKWIKQWELDAFYNDLKSFNRKDTAFDQYLKKYNIKKVGFRRLHESWEEDHTGTCLVSGHDHVWFIIPRDLCMKALVLGGFPDESNEFRELDYQWVEKKAV